MTMKEFIREHRAEIDAAINRALNHVPREASCYCPRSGTDHYHDNSPRRNDDERREWIVNDAGLCFWARREGVRI